VHILEKSNVTIFKRKIWELRANLHNNQELAQEDRTSMQKELQRLLREEEELMQ
jgi:hypothetical protein